MLRGALRAVPCHTAGAARCAPGSALQHCCSARLQGGGGETCRGGAQEMRRAQHAPKGAPEPGRCPPAAPRGGKGRPPPFWGGGVHSLGAAAPPGRGSAGAGPRPGHFCMRPFRGLGLSGAWSTSAAGTAGRARGRLATRGNVATACAPARPGWCACTLRFSAGARAQARHRPRPSSWGAWPCLRCRFSPAAATRRRRGVRPAPGRRV
jgi:hypothetical protein